MKRLEFKNGLLYTDIKIIHENKSIVVNDVIVDTGASHTIISPDYLEKLDVGFSENDTIVRASGYGGTIEYSVRKSIDRIECGDIILEDIRLDFGDIDPSERVNGLLGIDFLKASELIIDLVDNLLIKK
jgi:predicted aspartyl protease